MCECVKSVIVVLLYQLFSFYNNRMTVPTKKCKNTPSLGAYSVLSLEIVRFLCQLNVEASQCTFYISVTVCSC